MSELADRARSERQIWAMPGSSHDRVIRIAKLALPAGVALIGLLLAIAPISLGRDISFVLAKDSVDVARERLRLTEAIYRGEDSKGQPFMLKAGSAVQARSTEPVVRMTDLAATIMLHDGPAAFAAQRGRYDMEREQVAIDGPMVLKTADGYRLLAHDVNVDIRQRQVTGTGRINGEMPLGAFSADHLRADLNARTVTLDGRARLHIVQARSRGK